MQTLNFLLCILPHRDFYARKRTPATLSKSYPSMRHDTPSSSEQLSSNNSLSFCPLAEIDEKIINQKNDTNAIQAIRKCWGTTPKVKHWTGLQRLQYFTSRPFFRTSSVYLFMASLNEYWNITDFTKYATGKQRRGVITNESNNTLLKTVWRSVPWPNIIGKTSLKMISWAIP